MPRRAVLVLLATTRAAELIGTAPEDNVRRGLRPWNGFFVGAEACPAAATFLEGLFRGARRGLSFCVARADGTVCGEHCDVVLCETQLKRDLGEIARGWRRDNDPAAVSRGAPDASGAPAPCATATARATCPPQPLWNRACEAQGVGCDRRGTATPLDVVTSAYPVTRYWRGLKRSLPGGGVSRKDATYGGPRSPVPAFFGDFDWLALARPEFSWDKGLRDPTFVFAQPEALRALRARLERVAPAARRRLLYVGGSDARLSGPAPIGLNELYLQEADLAPLLASAAAAAPNKTGDVLAAWGAVWSKASTTARLPGRAAATDLCARRGGEAWLDCGAVAREDWWAALAGHKFMLDPAGHGVQSPKWYEALLAGAVPVCLREPAFEALAAAGWPMVLVDAWDDVADAAARDRWWASAGPRLAALRAAGALSAAGWFRYLQRSLDVRV
ncbi:hypothetical protein JL722_5035 [Aureococcus anophagefferens]|nr:hypothetical protein JL722_5035 [Aureococcus anophagefferens]